MRLDKMKNSPAASQFKYTKFSLQSSVTETVSPATTAAATLGCYFLAVLRKYRRQPHGALLEFIIKVQTCVCVYLNAPVSVQAGDGGLPVAVQVLRLLQQHVVEHPGDVDGDVVFDGLEHRHVGPHTGQQLAGLGDLLRGLVVHGHAHNGPADGGEAASRSTTTTSSGMLRGSW